ncbi:MAG: hypothetical protein NC418_00925 [Muribaculaceae bacterium]|nr:hypothetical protein [Muribaculaceae bacterium]
MTTFTRYTAALVGAVLMLGAAGCFTGVESTPRINASDVRKQDAAGISAEALFLADVLPEPPAQWRSGKKFLVANDRISLIFTAATSDATDSLAGHTIAFRGFSPAMSLMGDNATDAMFASDDGRTLNYRIAGVDASRLDTMASLELPFAVDLDLVARLDSALRGERYFVRTPAWYTLGSRESRHGLRHVEVRIDSVVPGDENFPAAVCFTLADTTLLPEAQRSAMLYMSVGAARKATRNFDVLFSFTDPRKRYPEIKDDVWSLIIRSKVRAGMSRDECRLALGAPPSLERIPTPGGMAERWRYSDGVFLIFEDGYLTRFRL